MMEYIFAAALGEVMYKAALSSGENAIDTAKMRIETPRSVGIIRRSLLAIYVLRLPN